MAKQHFFLRDRWLGARDIPTYTDIGETPSITKSYALFCPACADIWAKMMHDAKGAYCQCVTTFCPDHAYTPSHGTFSSNSPYQGDPRGDIQTMPRAVQLFDVASLSNFYINHPDKWYYS